MSPSPSSLLRRCLVGCVLALGGLVPARGASVDLTPISIGDGTYTQVTVAGQPVWQNSGTSGYLYCRRPDSFAFTVGQTLYVRATYYDDQGGGTVGLQYDGQAAAYTTPTVHTRTSRVGSGQFVDGFFELKGVFFGRRENGGTDFRLSCGASGGVKMSVQKITLSDTPFSDANFQLSISRPWQARYTGPAKDYVEATTLKGKVMVGYQGWFRTPNDLDDDGWRHWAGNNTMTAENFTTDMWPDLTEYDPATLSRAGSVMTGGGAPAYLFSSTSYPTVQKHFRWMRKHNIDGAFVQRFNPKAGAEPEWVLRNVSQAAAEQGLIWAVEYDVSGMSDSTVVAKLQADWQWLTTQFGILQDPRYAREGGKPVVFIWGFPFPDRNFTTTNANAAVDYFIAQGAYVIGGIPNDWSTLNTAWQTHIAKYDGILAWQNQATSDGATFRGRGQDFYPHLWPGFSWANLKQLPATPPNDYTDRSGGQFYWTKGRDWINGGGADRLFIGMFDEYDEGTAIMPMTDDPPDPSASYGRFLDNQGKPSDWWMMLTDELKRMMLQQRTNTNTLPTVASLSNRSNIGAEASVDLGATDIAASLSRVQQGDGDTIVETVGGKECRGNLDPATDRYLYFNVSNAFAYQLADGDVTVEVEYYDANTSTVLGLQYDSTSSVPTNPAYTTHPQSITTTGSNAWRRVRFEISDAWFGGRQNGSADFRLNSNGRKLNVNRVWVRLPEGKYFPFTWTNATPGPALNWSQNANWRGGIVAPSDLASTVQIFPGQTLAGGAIAITNNTAGGQQIGVLQLGGAAAPSAATTVTLGGNALSLGGSAPAIAFDATGSADFTYDIAAPLTLLGTTQVGGDGDATFRISGAIGGAGGLIKTGSSTLRLAGTASYTGPTNISGGRLALTGSLTSTVTASGGTFAPQGTPGTSGGLDISSGGRLELRLNGATPGTQYDQLTVGGSITLAGALDVITGPNLAPGSTFVILNKTSAGAVSGTFAGKAENSTFANATGYTFRINYNAGTGNDVVLTLVTSPIEQWRFTNFGSMLNMGNAADLSDHELDDLVNLLEYALGGNPNLASSAPLPRASILGDRLALTFTRTVSNTDITMIVQGADSLNGPWIDLASSISGAAMTPLVGGVTLTEGTGATRIAEVRDLYLTSDPAHPRRFIRLKVTKP